MPLLCPNCGINLDVPLSYAGRRVRCSSCKQGFDVPVDERDIPVVKPVSEGTPLNQDEPYSGRSRKGKRSRSGCLLIILALLAVSGGTCCCGGIWFMDYVDNPTFEAYIPPEGGYAVEFPGTPSTFSRPGLDGKASRGVEFVRELPQERYFVEFIRINQAEQKMDAQKLLGLAADSWAKATPNTKDEQRSPRDVNGYPAIDLVLKQGQFQGATLIRIIKVGDRLYSVGVSGQIQPEHNRGYKFLDSFKPDAAEKE